MNKHLNNFLDKCEGLPENTSNNNIEKELKECGFCNTVKESKPTPDGDEICPSCGDKEMMDYEL